MNSLKVIIVGGGVIGMLQARDLALKGMDVVLVEKGELTSKIMKRLNEATYWILNPAVLQQFRGL